MLSLDTRLSRREFVKLGCSAAASFLTIGSENKWTNLRPLIAERQKFLDELVQEEPAPYVRNVIYDHNGFSSGYRWAPNEAAITRYFSLYFGNGLKPDILFSQKGFGDFYLKTKQGTIKIPFKERLRVHLQHEYCHAEDSCNGIDLGDDLVINSSNYPRINPKVRTFVMEVRAYSRNVEFARQFGEDNPIFWHVLNDSAILTNDHYGNLKNVKLTKYEARLVDSQIAVFNQIHQEGRRIFEKYKLI